VTLGSLRVRQDFLIAEGLVADYQEGKPVDPSMLEMALARIRQLSAHEVGHTLGLQHNYIASANNRASVMDYPHPFVGIRADGSLDLSNAYATGIGEWDKISIDYGYRTFPQGVDERSALDGILLDGRRRGLTFLTDQDARPRGSAHPGTHLWDNGPDPVQELTRIMEIRRSALGNLSENRIRPGTPMAMLQDVLVPVYMSHRYQVEAAVKVIGGLEYTYAMRGDGQMPLTMVSPDDQRRALQAVLATTTPQELALPERILDIIPPRPVGCPSTREHFKGRTEATLDPLAAAETAAHHTFSLLLNPARCARLEEYHARDARYPGTGELLSELLDATWYARRLKGYNAAVQRSIDHTALSDIVGLALSEEASGQVRGHALASIAKLKEWLTRQGKTAKDADLLAHYAFGLSTIRTFEEHPEQVKNVRPPDPPAGAPIGCEMDF
jgi:hypothetical protein